MCLARARNNNNSNTNSGKHAVLMLKNYHIATLLIGCALAVACVLAGAFENLGPLAVVLPALHVSTAAGSQEGSGHQTELYYFAEKSLDAVPSDVRLLSAWLDFPVNSSLMPLADSQLHSLNVTVPIDKVHGEGLLHRGAWIAVLRKPALHSSGPLEILLLRRGLHLKTCPGGWSLVGEHANFWEEWGSIVLRALREELKLDVDNLRPVDLTPGHSLLVKTAYTTNNRLELQATKLFYVVVSEASHIEPDSEVSEVAWLTLQAFSAKLADGLDVCNDELGQLVKLVVRKLLHAAELLDAFA
ncbi:unnamed protein product [Polarella glacialis]|uniref:Nudix hydrolase domain-containing protein n=1 Tax=Polarella glacialis TaxID=89957 RepID=A0A813IU17_POLGL|nr:unnamed protein product [Polarella glacialis]